MGIGRRRGIAHGAIYAPATALGARRTDPEYARIPGETYALFGAPTRYVGTSEAEVSCRM